MLICIQTSLFLKYDASYQFTDNSWSSSYSRYMIDHQIDYQEQMIFWWIKFIVNTFAKTHKISTNFRYLYQQLVQNEISKYIILLRSFSWSLTSSQVFRGSCTLKVFFPMKKPRCLGMTARSPSASTTPAPGLARCDKWRRCGTSVDLVVVKR